MTARMPDGSGSGWAGARHAARIRARRREVSAGSRRTRGSGRRSRARSSLASTRSSSSSAAVAELLEFFISAADARRADEGRLWFFSRAGGATKLGDKLFPDTITLESDPVNPDTPGAPFDHQGVALARTLWVDRGVVSALAYSRYWAAKQGKQPTGRHSTLLLRGGTAKSADDLLSGVKRGLVVTRFWYTRWLEPKAMSITGLTRDGVFLVEDGRITGPVNNFRFNESPANVLANCDGMTAETTRVPNGEVWRVPTLRTHDFNMASVSAAV